MDDMTDLPPDYFIRPDESLQMLAYLAHTGIGLGITLTTAAGLITGDTISGGEFYHQIAHEIRETTGDQTHPLAMIFQDRADIANAAAEQSRAAEEIDDEEIDQRGYIHLRNAQLVAGPTWHNVGLWRGDLTDVIGWTLGNLQRSS